MPEGPAPPTPGSAMKEAATEAAGEAAGEAAEAAGEAADASGSSISLTDALMSTEPDVDPRLISEQFSVGPAASNAIVGLQKVMKAITGLGEKGTTALENFVVAGVHTVRSGVGRDDDRDDQEENDDDVDDVEADGEYRGLAVGGDGMEDPPEE